IDARNHKLPLASTVLPVSAIVGNGRVAAPRLRQRLGVYYTPSSLADRMVDWALPDAGSALDPSFGGCSFLASAITRLSNLGVRNPGALVYGVDVDEAAMPYAECLRTAGLPTGNALIRDFFDIEPGDHGPTEF